ncbi:MAG: hypothetical protein JWQ09_4710 [Segetibacter sp.]|nr:hypothetical protein [Segetibacter sp.]
MVLFETQSLYLFLKNDLLYIAFPVLRSIKTLLKAKWSINYH